MVTTTSNKFNSSGIYKLVSGIVNILFIVAAYQRYGFLGIGFVIVLSFVVGAIKYSSYVKLALQKMKEDVLSSITSTPKPKPPTVTQSPTNEGKVISVDDGEDSEGSVVLGFVGEHNIADYQGTIRELLPGEEVTLSREGDNIIRLSKGDDTEEIDLNSNNLDKPVNQYDYQYILVRLAEDKLTDKHDVIYGGIQ